MNQKVKVAGLSIISNSILITLKFIIGIFTGSVSIVSEAIHSTMDLAASIIAFISVRLSSQPPDKGHPYGHEKIENISGVTEATLIIVASILIIYEAVKKLLHHEHVTQISWGVLVMVVSCVMNIIVSRKLYKVARKEESVALEADALHLKVDVYTSLGVALGLLLLWITDLHFLDPMIAIIIATLILKEAYDMLKHAYSPLVDSRLTDDEIRRIEGVIERYKDIFIGLHDLRTRRAGKIKHIDLHLTAPPYMTIKEYHQSCDLIEKNIEAALNNTSVLIHIEPCEHECGTCTLKKISKYCKPK